MLKTPKYNKLEHAKYKHLHSTRIKSCSMKFKPHSLSDSADPTC